MDGLLTAIREEMMELRLAIWIQDEKNMENADYGSVSQSKEPRIVPL